MRKSLASAGRVALLLLGLAPVLGGQGAAAALTAGDQAYAALDAVTALAQFERAAVLDTASYEAAWKASRSAADLETSTRDAGTRRETLLRQAENHARRAVALRPNGAEGYFSLARALGLAARSVGIRERVRYANDVRDYALRCLRYEPEHAGCLHVLGAWNYEVMRLSGVERFLARRLLGGHTFGSASWDDAIRYMERSIVAEPARMIHRVELGDIYRAVGRNADARRQYEAALALPASDYNDPVYREQARAALQALGR